MTTPLSPQLFEKDDVTNWKQHLDEYGFVVLTNILTSEEKTEAFNLFKKDLSTVSPNFDFDDTNTWNIQNCPLMFGKGMAVFNGFGQSDFMWNLRVNSSIKSIYKNIYDCEELVVSLDGFSMFVSNKQKSKPWLHIDQNPKNDMYSIQGSYNFMKVDEKDAGFVIVPKSHKTYSPKVDYKKDWILCDTGDSHLSNSKKLIIPENCFTLWNSKLIHANEGMTKSGIELNRLTTYISYQPKINRTETIYKKRLEAYKNGDTTSHWSNKCEIKQYPWGFKPRYLSRGFQTLKPTFEKESVKTEKKIFNVNRIPKDRLELL